MRVLICESRETAADWVAEEIIEALMRKPNLVLGLATGSTPMGVYRRLVAARRERGIDFSRVVTFNLDEYLDLPAEHEQSYRRFMKEHLFDGVNVPEGAIHFPPSEGKDLNRRCRQYEETIRRCGGIDLQVLGIGANGHIGFNEPTSSLGSRTRIKTLTAKTLSDNTRFFHEGERIPQMAATMGIGTILEARRIVLEAFGSDKADSVYAAVEGPISSFWPASALQLHPDVTFYLDRTSAARLSQLEYYERVAANDRIIRDRE
jgi:glucosamine-6-phosphate deaminase